MERSPRSTVRGYVFSLLTVCGGENDPESWALTRGEKKISPRVMLHRVAEGDICGYMLWATHREGYFTHASHQPWASLITPFRHLRKLWLRGRETDRKVALLMWHRSDSKDYCFHYITLLVIKELSRWTSGRPCNHTWGPRTEQPLHFPWCPSKALVGKPYRVLLLEEPIKVRLIHTKSRWTDKPSGQNFTTLQWWIRSCSLLVLGLSQVTRLHSICDSKEQFCLTSRNVPSSGVRFIWEV